MKSKAIMVEFDQQLSSVVGNETAFTVTGLERRDTLSALAPKTYPVISTKLYTGFQLSNSPILTGSAVSTSIETSGDKISIQRV